MIRADLEMPPGKLAAQAGHAFTSAFQAAVAAGLADPLRPGLWTKIVLAARWREDLERIHAAARDLGLPSALVVDSGHVLPPHFTGAPVITALGIGPCDRARARTLVRHCKLV